MRVLKYPFGHGRRLDIHVDPTAKVLSVHAQRGKPTLWLQCNEALTSRRRTFVAFMTGEEMHAPEGKRLEFVGTVLLEAETYVLRIFEEVSA